MLTGKQIETNIGWLLENGSTPVKYLTHKHLLNSPQKEIRGLWKEVENSKEAVDIFSKQKKDGSWFSGGLWAPTPSYIPKDGYSAFTPKYVTAVWILAILGDMGFEFNNSRAKKASEYCFNFQSPEGGFSRFIKAKVCQLQDSTQANAPCDLSVYLTGFGKVGMGNDRRLKKSYDLLIQWQREDGGWVNQKHKEEKNWSRSCPWVSHYAASAFYHSKLPEHKDALYKALKFLVWHLSLKSEDELRRFYYHGHNMVKELLMFSESGIGIKERPVKTLLDWFLNMYDSSSGCFIYRKDTKIKKSSSPEIQYRLYHTSESDWLTYYLTRIAVNLG